MVDIIKIKFFKNKKDKSYFKIYNLTYKKSKLFLFFFK